MRNIAVGEYYHIYNRGALKRKIFLDERDWVRFLFLILYCQSDITFINLNRPVTYFVKHSVFNIKRKGVEEIAQTRGVTLIAFALMPNHFHLILENVQEYGIARYMQRALNAYTKYFNTKYRQTGHLFQGQYKSVHIADNDQLLYLSAYIHKHRTAWSSAKDYFKNNRWGALLQTEIISAQFTNGVDYQRWVKENPTKEPEWLSE